jgi:tryptophan synthase alpha chain
VNLCRGFVYLLARVGITGERQALPDVAGRVEAVRRLTDLPVAVGFGISRPEHVAAATAVADAAVVGSAFVRRMGEDRDPAGSAADFARSLAAALAPRGPASGSGPQGGR